MLRSSAVLLLCLLSSACVMGRGSENEPLDPQLLDRLQPGKTTAKEVVDLLGAPTEVVQLYKRSAYRYDHVTTKYAGLILLVVNFGNIDARTDRLWVFFDENQVLYSVGKSLAAHRTQYAMPWEDVHEKADNDARDAERFPGK